jgi:hypothetical protein
MEFGTGTELPKLLKPEKLELPADVLDSDDDEPDASPEPPEPEP